MSFYSYHPKDGFENQAVAFSRNGRDWFKFAKNPVIAPLRGLPGQQNDPQFRDPKVFWHQPTQRWVMILGAAKLHLYTSQNLLDWKLESMDPAIATECPDLFELPVDGNPAETKWVLSRSGVTYHLGTFDGHKFTPETEALPLGGAKTELYASQSWNEAPEGRRVSISWLIFQNQSKLKSPWSSAQSLPVELGLRRFPEGIRLVQTPIKELESLRQSTRNWKDQEIKEGVVPIADVNGVTLEIEAVFEPGDAKRFGLALRKGRDEQTLVGYNPVSGKMFIDRSHAGLTAFSDDKPLMEAPTSLAGGRVKMHLFVDDSIIEAFGNDGQSRLAGWIFPSPASDGIAWFAEGGTARCVSLAVHELKSIWRDEPPSGGKPTQVMLGRSALKLPVGATKNLSAQVLPRTAANQAVTWSSSRPDCVEVRGDDVRNATITAKNPGEATLTASSVEGKKTDQAWVRVYQPSFRSNVADWAPDDENAWLEIPSGLQGSAETKAYNQATHAGLQTGRIETEISVAPHSKAGFTFRDNGRHKFCYSVLLDADKKQVSLQRIAEWKIQPLQSQDVPLESGTPARIGVQIDQGVLQVFFNGKPIFQAPDEGVDAGCRRIALVVERGQAVFQNFQLSEKK